MINKTKTYLVLNACGSPVAVNTRNESFLIPGGTDAAPGTYPFTIDEITQINSGSNIFRIGILRFEPEYESDIYEELRIRDWKNILKNEDIENMLLHPTIESLQRIIDIDNDMYFERVYGIYIGMKNANYAIPGNTQSVLNAKNKEMKAGKYHSAIKLKKPEVKEIDPEVEDLKAQLEGMKKLLAETIAKQQNSAAEVKSADEPEKKASPKSRSATPASRKKTGTKKK